MQSPWAFKARLVHAEPGQRVVQVSAWQGENCLGSCLGEAANAEEAEQRALERLQKRLGAPPAAALPEPATAMAEELPDPPPRRHPVVRHPQSEATETSVEHSSAAQHDLFAAETSSTAGPPPSPAPVPEPPADPDDWSDELAELDVQLQRIGWDRNQESVYLQRAFGHPSRNRLTAYADLVSYLRSLRNLPAGADAATAPVPLRRRDLLEQCDQLLRSLQWDAQRGRQLLEQQFQLSSRQQLSDEQLLQFNMLLEEQMLAQQADQAGASLQ
jgi:hypothetical protein